MLQRLRENLTLILIALLPLHAFLVTVTTKVIQGPGHPPMAELAVWKELLLLTILFIAVMEIAIGIRKRTMRIGTLIECDTVDLLILGLCVLAGIVTARIGFSSATLLGIKYDLAPLLSFLLLRRLPWSVEFVNRITYVLLGVGAVIANYGLLTMILPVSFFRMLGYSDLHSIYLPDAPLPAFHQVDGTMFRRIQSTMSGPNQLGMWLLIPWALAWSLYGRRRVDKTEQWTDAMFIVLCLPALFLTFSRATWIAAFVIVVLALVRHLHGARLHHILTAIVMLACTGALLLMVMVPSLILRTQSTRDHFDRPLAAAGLMKAHPFGMGLASAGPASNHLRDACVHLPARSSIRWAEDRPSLCVFVGGIQRQPTDRTCSCPVLPENWYLQIGVELGVLGMLIFLSLVGFMIFHLHRHIHIMHWHPWPVLALRDGVLLAFLGVSIAALVLHAWEDAALAYSLWILLAVVVSPRED